MNGTASWVAEPEDPLPSPASESDPVRVVICLSCARVAANPPGSFGECVCGSETRTTEIARDEYARMRRDGDRPEVKDD